MKKIIDIHQKSDMGSGFGHYENINGKTLKEVLDWLEENTKTWGVITIYNDNKILRKFDYELYNYHYFYHHLSGWEEDLKVSSIKFNYCFMYENIDIYLQ